jgi:hypothetical protein
VGNLKKLQVIAFIHTNQREICKMLTNTKINAVWSTIKFSLKGIVSRDLMRKKRPFDGFIGWIISLRYSWIWFIFNFKAIFKSKFINLYAQPVYLW